MDETLAANETEAAEADLLVGCGQRVMRASAVLKINYRR